MIDYKPEDAQCPVCGYYCLGKGGFGCIDKPKLVAGCAQEETKVNFNEEHHRTKDRERHEPASAFPEDQEVYDSIANNYSAEADRKLLELAAKAAGIKLQWSDTWQAWYDFNKRHEGKDFCEWNPLTDDGDALRLAVKLRLFDGRMFEDQRIALAVSKRLNFKNHIEEDEYAATRRAIVRAAAEIGKGMK